MPRSDTDPIPANPGLFGSGEGIVAMHLQGLTKGRVETLHQFIARLALPVHTRHFDDPANPERAVLLNDSCELLARIPKADRLCVVRNLTETL